MTDGDGVRQVTRFQAVCPSCGWESEDLYDEVQEARWRFEKHEAHSCDSLGGPSNASKLVRHIDGLEGRGA